jgi:lysozyme
MSIEKLLEFEEGFRETAYYCSEGYPTIGIGWKIGEKHQPLEDFSLISICKGAALAQCKNEAYLIGLNLHCVIDCWQDLSEARQSVLISMTYQMGLSGLMKFKKMLAAIESGSFALAANEGLDSKWAKQTPERARRHMNTMLSGDWSEYDF